MPKSKDHSRSRKISSSSSSAEESLNSNPNKSLSRCSSSPEKVSSKQKYSSPSQTHRKSSSPLQNSRDLSSADNSESDSEQHSFRDKHNSSANSSTRDESRVDSGKNTSTYSPGKVDSSSPVKSEAGSERDSSDDEKHGSASDSGRSSDKNNNNEAKSDQSESDSEKSKAGSISDSGSVSISEVSGAESDGKEKVTGSSRSASRTSSSASSTRERKKNLKKYWENDPSTYGVRRSARERKQPDRISIETKSSSDKKTRRRSSAFHSSDLSLSEDSSDDERSSRQRNNARKASKAKKNDSDKDSEKRRRNVRYGAVKVDYKETESEHESENEDVVGVEWNNQEEDLSIQTIEKVIDWRIGKKGAVGIQTYIYEVEKNGDPNVDFDPKNPSEVEEHFKIKWKGWAHVHNTWESFESLKDMKAKGLKKLDNYVQKEKELKRLKKSLSPEDVEYIEIQGELEFGLFKSHLQAERIFSEVVEDGSSYYYVKWTNLPYSEATWETEVLVADRFEKQLDDFKRRENSDTFPRTNPVLKHRPRFSEVKEQPDFIGGDNEDLELRDYQVTGLNWLLSSWCKHNSVILADEMGLGKTIQVISFLSYLFHVHKLYGPFLIVVPLSTMNAWQREFAQWAPDINVIVYIGDRDSRRIIVDYEWTYGESRIKFNAVLTTNEILLRDKEVLRDSCQWAVLAIDEAHKIKNEESQLYQALQEFKSNHRVLITGTPLQNSLKELWALLHFIMPFKFDDWEYFESQHNENNMKKGFAGLHKQLEPFLLRRVKKDVEKSLPSKVEQILRVDMTQGQRQYYKWILTKNYEMLKKGAKGSTSGFLNIVMELKKCCNHSFLTKQNDDNATNATELLQQLLRGSGKLMLLDKLLVRLHETGHRVLIFSQMVRMLDIMAQYLELRRFPFQRLDGSIPGDVRRQALDHFNAEGSPDFCFLLSTKAGGLGINLATADTVIIFDSDWNPQNDLQAQARAHRIGQKNQVNIYRLVTKSSIEETIIERAKQKMVLDHLVIQSMDTSGRTIFNKRMSNTNPFNKDELNAILKFKADELFQDDSNQEEPVCDIDEILQRAETRDEGPTTASDDLLSQFKVASFNIDENEEVSRIDLLTSTQGDPKDWDDIIPENMRKIMLEEQQKEKMAELYLAPRKRKTLKAAIGADRSDTESPKKRFRKDSDTSEYEAEVDSEDESTRRKKRQKVNNREAVRNFSEAEIRRFFRALRKFGNPLSRLTTIANEADLRDKSHEDMYRLGSKILERCRETLKEYNDSSTKLDPSTDNKQANRVKASFKLGGVTINAKTVLGSLDELEPLDRAMPKDPKERESWEVPMKWVKDPHWDTEWDLSNDAMLLKGVYEYGMGSWDQIKGDPNLKLGDKILLEEAKKPQAKQLENRVSHLLKLIRKIQGISKVRVTKGKSKNPQKIVSKEIVDKVSTDDEKEKVSIKENVSTKDKVEDLPDKQKEKAEKKRKKKENVAGPVHITANGQPLPVGTTEQLSQEHQHWPECKNVMRPLKKALRELSEGGEDKPIEEKAEMLGVKLIKIGDHIEDSLSKYENDHESYVYWKKLLWQFVTFFATDFAAKKLHKIYKKNKEKNESKIGDKSETKQCDKIEKNRENVEKHKHKKSKKDRIEKPEHKSGNSKEKSEKKRKHHDSGESPLSKKPYSSEKSEEKSAKDNSDKNKDKIRETKEKNLDKNRENRKDKEDSENKKNDYTDKRSYTNKRWDNLQYKEHNDYNKDRNRDCSSIGYRQRDNFNHRGYHRGGSHEWRRGGRRPNPRGFFGGRGFIPRGMPPGPPPFGEFSPNPEFGPMYRPMMPQTHPGQGLLPMPMYGPPHPVWIPGPPQTDVLRPAEPHRNESELPTENFVPPEYKKEKNHEEGEFPDEYEKRGNRHYKESKKNREDRHYPDPDLSSGNHRSEKRYRESRYYGSPNSGSNRHYREQSRDYYPTEKKYGADKNYPAEKNYGDEKNYPAEKNYGDDKNYPAEKNYGDEYYSGGGDRSHWRSEKIHYDNDKYVGERVYYGDRERGSDSDARRKENDLEGNDSGDPCRKENDLEGNDSGDPRRKENCGERNDSTDPIRKDKSHIKDTDERIRSLESTPTDPR